MSLSRALSPEPTMADRIESGRHFYATKKYRPAWVAFTVAMKSCPCSKGVKRGRCTCKNFEKVAAQGGSIFQEAMHTCHCDVGRMFSKCDDGYHIQALESRAATFEALGLLDRAMKDAEWILELAPRLPDGYLCVGKIAQLKKHDEYAWMMYTAGIEAHKEGSVDSSPKLQQLYDARKPLNRRFFRQDPLSLPGELVTHIFSYLEWTKILLCLSVCKQWMRTLTSPLHGQLWRNINIRFPHKWLCKRSPASYLDLLKKILSWAGDGGFRKIDIALNHDFLTQTDFTLLLNASPRLEHLEVYNLYHFSLPSKEKIWNQLRHVTIDVDHFEPGQFPYRFLQNAASSLEHLTFILADVPNEWYDSEPLIPHLPKLKSLRIGGWEGGRGTPFSMYPFAIAFPRIEQLWMGPNLPDVDPGPVASWRDKWEGVWPHLKVLIFESYEPDGYEPGPFSGLRYLMCLNRGNSLLHLQFINIYPDSGDEIRDIFGNNHYRLPASDVIRHSDLRNLRSVRSNYSMWILPDRARIMLSKSIKNGQLTSFDITFPEYVPTRESSPGDLSVRHLKGYDWLRGAPSIHTLGLYSFHFLLDRRNYEDLPLPQFLATFPNLRTLRLCGGFVNEQEIEEIEEDEFVSVIVAIMSVTRLKTIHMAMRFFGHNSETLRKLRKAAHLKGVQISTADGYYPEQWPIPLGP